MRATLAIRYAPVASLKAYHQNARTHSPEQVAEIAGSIKAFGFVNPILVGEDGVVIAGHGRLAAARLLQMASVPTLPLRGLTAPQRRALALADNRIPMNASWDADMLRAELTDLRAMGASLQVLGFTEDELAAILSPPTKGLTDPDDVPPVPEVPVSRPGDLWVLGRHRLLCGDATVATDVDRVLGGVKPLLMVTDPPYGVQYDPAWRERYDQFKRHAVGKVENDERSDWQGAWSLFPGDVAYVWHGGLHAATVQASLEACGFSMRAQIIWRKQHFVFGRGDYHWQHEPCWYAVRGTGHYGGDRKQTTVWDIQNHNPMGGHPDDMTSGHGAQKPVECMRRPILNNSSPGQAIYDPFVGSGTTIIAAEMEGRSCHAIEVNPAYVDVSVQRWQAFTGQAATLDGSGQAFKVSA